MTFRKSTVRSPRPKVASVFTRQWLEKLAARRRGRVDGSQIMCQGLGPKRHDEISETDRTCGRTTFCTHRVLHGNTVKVLQPLTIKDCQDDLRIFRASIALNRFPDQTPHSFWHEEAEKLIPRRATTNKKIRSRILQRILDFVPPPQCKVLCLLAVIMSCLYVLFCVICMCQFSCCLSFIIHYYYWFSSYMYKLLL